MPSRARLKRGGSRQPSMRPGRFEPRARLALVSQGATPSITGDERVTTP